MNDLKKYFDIQQWKSLDRVSQIISLNIFVFIFIKLIFLIEFLFQTGSSLSNLIVYYLSLPASPGYYIYRPWSIITYQFTHEGFFHILFNLLWLHWFGKLIVEYINEKRFLAIYLLGGISGGIFFMLIMNILPAFSNIAEVSTVIGASAGVMAIVIAAATLLPNYSINLLFIGAVRLKFIALFYVIFDLLSIPTGNAGGHLAHLGGALFGFLFIKLLNNGTDLSKLIPKVQSKNKLKVSYSKKNTTTSTNPSQQEIDAILDKISAKGYDQLTAKEKEILFKAGKK